MNILCAVVTKTWVGARANTHTYVWDVEGWDYLVRLPLNVADMNCTETTSLIFLFGWEGLGVVEVVVGESKVVIEKRGM